MNESFVGIDLIEEEIKLPEFMPEERSEEYLDRISNLLRDKRPKVGNIHLEKNHPQNFPEYEEFMSKVLSAVKENDKVPKRKFSAEKGKENVRLINSKINSANNKQRLDENGNIDFSHTNQTRDFFGDLTGGGNDNFPYSRSLFNLAIDTPEAREYFSKRLKDKTIYLFGGGNSITDLIGSEEHHPKHIVNIDPYIKTEPVEVFEKGTYESIPVAVQNSEQVESELEKLNIPKADEIWASYSVPYYLATPLEIKGMFKTIRESLAENGTARITPIRLQMEDEIFYRGAVDEFMNQVQLLADSPEFNVYSTEDTMFIEKILPSESNQS